MDGRDTDIKRMGDMHVLIKSIRDEYFVRKKADVRQIKSVQGATTVYFVNPKHTQVTVSGTVAEAFDALKEWRIG